ncbi:MAG TPA: hypothetical protein VJM11_05985 [Nevskiaceae bacterium]|nr:hypothetical protein [Nevskiaceae bacterium]
MNAKSGKVQGEGDYESAKRYDDETREFVEKGKVEPAARAAKPKSEAEAKEMERAEDRGRARSHGEDPALSKGTGHRSS